MEGWFFPGLFERNISKLLFKKASCTVNLRDYLPKLNFTNMFLEQNKNKLLLWNTWIIQKALILSTTY